MLVLRQDFGGQSAEAMSGILDVASRNLLGLYELLGRESVELGDKLDVPLQVIR